MAPVRLSSPHVPTLLFFAVLATAHTWPLMSDPANLCRNDNADAQLNEWILSWIAHALRTNPFGLFDANIFHPEPRALAFSESLIVQGVMGAPLAWLGASPVLVMNLLTVAGLTLTGWAMSVLIAAWTGERWAGLLAGSIAAFNAHTLTRLMHVQAMHVEFLPFAWLALDRVLRHQRVRDAAALAGWFVLQSLCSGYLLVITAVALAAGLASRTAEAVGRWPRVGWLLALAGLGAAAALAPFLWPYAQVRDEQSLVRTLDEVARYSASWQDYLSIVSRVHFPLWSHAFYRGTDALFPGVVALGLTVVAVVSGRAWRDPRARMLLVAGIAGFLLSFGPRFPPYAWLYEAVPIVQGIRGAARLGFLFILASAGLAGFGLAELMAAWRRKRRTSLAGQWIRPATIAATAVLAANIEVADVPMYWVPFEGIPPIYRTLASEPGAVVEVPFPPPDRTARNGGFVLASTTHWRPLVNGYSGFVPGSYVRHYEQLEAFPSPSSLDALRGMGVTHVVVHVDHDPALAERAASTSGLRRVAQGPSIQIYRLD